MLDRARARGETPPTLDELIELVLAPLYFYALFDRPGGPPGLAGWSSACSPCRPVPTSMVRTTVAIGHEAAARGPTGTVVGPVHGATPDPHRDLTEVDPARPQAFQTDQQLD